MTQAKSEWIQDVTEADFERAVIQQSHERPVVVDFWAPWCGPCRALGPVLERLVAAENGQVALAKVNVDEAPNLAAAFDVQSIPAVKAFRNGRVELEFVGVLPEAQLRQFLERLRPSEADQIIRAAAAAEATDLAKAEADYRRALVLEPRHAAASLGLARVLLGRGQDAEAEELLGRLDYLGELADEADRLRALLELRKGKPAAAEPELRRRAAAEPGNAPLLLELGSALAAAGNYAEALATLLKAAEADRKLGGGPVREKMVQIFKTVGVRSPLADEYRDKLARVLY